MSISLNDDVEKKKSHIKITSMRPKIQPMTKTLVSLIFGYNLRSFKSFIQQNIRIFIVFPVLHHVSLALALSFSLFLYSVAHRLCCLLSIKHVIIWKLDQKLWIVENFASIIGHFLSFFPQYAMKMTKKTDYWICLKYAGKILVFSKTKQNRIVCCTSKSPHSYQKSIINNLWANESWFQYEVLQIEFVGEHGVFCVCSLWRCKCFVCMRLCSHGVCVCVIKRNC